MQYYLNYLQCKTDVFLLMFCLYFVWFKISIWKLWILSIQLCNQFLLFFLILLTFVQEWNTCLEMWRIQPLAPLPQRFHLSLLTSSFVFVIPFPLYSLVLLLFYFLFFLCNTFEILLSKWIDDESWQCYFYIGKCKPHNLEGFGCKT